MTEKVELKIEDAEYEINPYVDAKGEMPEILYEDDDIVIPAKPADMPTHPSHNHQNDTLAARTKQMEARQGSDYPIIFIQYRIAAVAAFQQQFFYIIQIITEMEADYIIGSAHAVFREGMDIPWR